MMRTIPLPDSPGPDLTLVYNPRGSLRWTIENPNEDPECATVSVRVLSRLLGIDPDLVAARCKDTIEGRRAAGRLFEVPRSYRDIRMSEPVAPGDLPDIVPIEWNREDQERIRPLIVDTGWPPAAKISDPALIPHLHLSLSRGDLL